MDSTSGIINLRILKYNFVVVYVLTIERRKRTSQTFPGIFFVPGIKPKIVEISQIYATVYLIYGSLKTLWDSKTNEFKCQGALEWLKCENGNSIMWIYRWLAKSD